MNQKNETVKCVECDRTVLKAVAYEKGGKLYCCADCAHGKTCDCQ